MTFDDLGKSWQATNGGALSDKERDELVKRVFWQVGQMGGVIIRRDRTETIAAVFVVIFFAAILLVCPGLLAKSGALIVIVGALFIIHKIHRTRTIQRQSPLDAPVRDFCQTEMQRLDRQIQLLRSVLWWYIAPIMVGVNLLFFGIAGVGVVSFAYLIATLGLACWIYWMNQKAVASELIPTRDDLATLFHEMGGAGNDGAGNDGAGNDGAGNDGAGNDGAGKDENP